VDRKAPNLKRAPIAIIIFIAALVFATFKVFGMNLPTAVMLGAFLVFVTKCISPDDAYREVEWKALILVASMLALGMAMQETGAARFLAKGLTNLTGDLSPRALLTAFFVLTVVLTQPMSNQAAAVVVFPVAIETALNLGLNPRTFAMMIAVAASCSYLTPLEPSCLMVYGPGRYKFADFLKVGSVLTILIYLVAIFLVPHFWPVHLK
jgi:di/tricarboxylate transporter